MSCPLTVGYNLDCRDSLGGVKSVRIATLADWVSLGATVVSGDVTAVTATSPASQVFWKYEQLKETSSLTETINASAQNGTVYYSPEVAIVISKLATAMRNEIKLLAQNRLVAIVETNDEVPSYFVVGVSNGLDVSAGTSGTGTAYADLQGYNITMSGMEAAPMLKLAPSILTIDALLTLITN
tara:strand:- start:125 stop:673 length:549 start_codon:yes stop_codon:yes gene_type:complete